MFPLVLIAIGVFAVLAAREKPSEKLSDLAHEELASPHDGYASFVIYQDTRLHNAIVGRYRNLDDAKSAIRDTWGVGQGRGVYFVYAYASGDIVDQHANLT